MKILQDIENIVLNFMDDKQVSKSSWMIISQFKKVLHIYNENKLCISWRNHIWVSWKKNTWNVMFFTSSKNSWQIE